MISRLVCLALSTAFVACAADEPGTPAPTGRAYPLCPQIEGVSLTDRAAWFDRIAIERHMPLGQNLIHAVQLTEDLTGVQAVNMSDNAGSWSAIYTASQAYRFAVTRDPEAMDHLLRAFSGQETVLRITGVPGLFARASVPLGTPTMPTEEQLLASYPDCDLSLRHCKRWTKVESGEFAGHMFKNDVSKDEYTGQVFALGVIAKLIKDPDIQARVKGMLLEIGNHLIDHDLEIQDIDGRTTTFGYMSPLSLNDWPGFNALLTLSWFRVAATVTEDPRLLSFYENCLVRRDLSKCEKPDLATLDSYLVHLESMGLDLDCQTNWNNHHMSQLAMFSLIDYETDPTLKATYQRILQTQMWDADDPRPMREQHNSLFTLFWELNRSPETAFPETELNQAVCILKEIPEEKYQRAFDATGMTEVCRDRNDTPLGNDALPLLSREIDNYLWKKNPYELERVAENRRVVESPEDFLLAYWLARHRGILPE